VRFPLFLLFIGEEGLGRGARWATVVYNTAYLLRLVWIPLEVRDDFIALSAMLVPACIVLFTAVIVCKEIHGFTVHIWRLIAYLCREPIEGEGNGRQSNRRCPLAGRGKVNLASTRII
jgi:hypothetical protein